jgi:hypothetical protein
MPGVAKTLCARCRIILLIQYNTNHEQLKNLGTRVIINTRGKLIGTRETNRPTSPDGNEPEYLNPYANKTLPHML